MPPMLIPALAFIVIVLLAVGLPSLAVVIIKYFKLRERELAIEMEYRQKSQQQGLAIEQRVHGVEQRVERLEQVLTSLDHDVRDRLGIKSSPATRSRRARSSSRGPQRQMRIARSPWSPSLRRRASRISIDRTPSSPTPRHWVHSCLPSSPCPFVHRFDIVV